MKGFLFLKYAAACAVFCHIFLFGYVVKSDAALPPLTVSAESAVLMEQSSGRILFSKNAHLRLPIASITKIMTAIIAIESNQLNETVRISRNAAYTEGSSIYLKPGQKMKLKDLVYGLMLRSGNDAAVAIAEFLGGSVEGFAFLMNQKAQEIGMTDTYFSNPSGLDAGGDHYSTAYDMALLTRYAMKNATFRAIFKTETYRPGSGEGGAVWRNKNKLLALYPYSTGGKTGYTKKAGRTLVSTAKKGDMKLIAVTLNAPDDWNDHMAMFRYGFEHFTMKTIVEDGKVRGINNDFYKNSVYLKKDITLPLAEGEMDQLHVKIRLYQAPKNGKWPEGVPPEPVGKLYVILGDERLAERPLFYRKSTTEENESLFERLKEIFLIIAGVRTNG